MMPRTAAVSAMLSIGMFATQQPPRTEDKLPQDVVLPAGRALHPALSNAELPSLTPHEWNACGSQLPPGETALVWPPEQRWMLVGWTWFVAHPGTLEFQVIDARSDRLVASATCRVSDPVHVVLARRWKESALELEIAQLTSDRKSTLTRTVVPAWATPTKAEAAVESEFEPNHSSHYRGEDGVWRLIRTLSWNGPNSDMYAEIKHPDPHGDGHKGKGSYTGRLRALDPKLRELPLAAWPEPVWFLRVRYTRTK